ncbi:MAG: nucleotide sugar dehydrogenase [Holosporales bacterium]|nr:nucleotide sugar dehydrogenase [Holosporales bacterium]
MQITVVGGGYVGLVSAICFCEFGFNVQIVESSPERFKKLKGGVSPVYEAGLEQSLQKHLAADLLTISNSVTNLTRESDAIVVAVSTRNSMEEDLNLSALHKAMKEISFSLSENKYVGIFIKTSVPTGTCSIIANNTKFIRPDLISGKHYDIIANPGFLREGTAICDFMNPNGIIIGLESNSKKAKDLVEKVYASLLDAKIPFLYTNFETAELVRSTTIGFLATKMAFINEIADLCDRTGADIDVVIKGISLDQGIGPKNLAISPGFGGTSFPKTLRILSNTASSLGIDLKILNGVIKSNIERISNIKNRIVALIEDEAPLSSKKVTILGLSFKPLTNDIKDSASIFVIRDLLNSEICVHMYDPVFIPDSLEVSKIPTDILENKNFFLAESVYDAVNQSDIAVIMTNWAEFMSLDFNKINELMNKKPKSNPILLDYRNMFSKFDLQNFNYISQGNK